MPGLANQLVAAKAAGVLGDLRTIGNDPDCGGAAAHGNRFASLFGRYAVAVAINPHQAGAGGAQHLLEIAVKGRAERA